MEYIGLKSDIQFKNQIMSSYQTFIRPLLPEKNVFHFTTMPYSCPHFLICQQIIPIFKDHKTILLHPRAPTIISNVASYFKETPSNMVASLSPCLSPFEESFFNF